MTTTAQPAATPEIVAKHATTTARLPARTLLGVFGSEATPMALIRQASGTISRVGVGDLVGREVVQAIGIDKVVLARPSGATKTLRLPRG